MDDILNSGGAFTPEMEVDPPEMTANEKAEIKAEKAEARSMRVLANSTAWQKVKDEFKKEFENLRFEVTRTVENQDSLEEIGQRFKIYSICEAKLLSLIERVENMDYEPNDEE